MSNSSGTVLETVGSLLAIVANSVQDALRVLMFADKRAWGRPEFEQLRLLEETLDEAKRDFQELPALVNGRFYYENDRKPESLDELRELCTRFAQHSQSFKDWIRIGGSLDPELAHQTRWLRRELHRAQCRAARRIRDDLETANSRPRCLGALLVWRSQQQQVRQNQTQPQTHSQPQQYPQSDITPMGQQPERSSNVEIAACNSTGVFQRFGTSNHDIAFVCDFCDGFLVWEDLRSMPSTRQRAASSAPSMSENWAATGFTNPQISPHRQTHSRHQSRTYSRTNNHSHSGPLDIELRTSGESGFADAIPSTEKQGEEKIILFPPVAIANHLPPEPGEWQAPLLCPLCDDYFYEEQGDGDMDRVRYTQDEQGFETVADLQQHLEWSHASLLPSLTDVAPKASNCAVM
ncbi:hypothetical protein GGR57DRAFT_53730 [Xylariaceae sp. FL1272]|nr:hypothetical protein GGR57DRAFT_53730 [Xylariaceae sp. FL1272]